MSARLPVSEFSSGIRKTLLLSLALFRALAAAVTAVAALASGVHLCIATVRAEVKPLTAKWKWVFFASTLIAAFMVIMSLKFYYCLREIDTERRRRGLRMFIITCVVMGILEVAVGGLAFADSRSPAVTAQIGGTSEWVSFVVVYCLCLLLVALEIVSIIIALTCNRSQLYEKIATAKESGDVVEFARRPSSVGGVDDMEFSIENIDNETTRTAEDLEEEPLREENRGKSSTNAKDGALLVNNELYGVSSPVDKIQKRVPPPIPPVKTAEESFGGAPPIPSSPIPIDDELDRPTSPKSPTFPRYERGSRGSTPGTSPLFPRYVDTSFAHYNPQLGTFLRPRLAPDDTVEPPQQEAGQLQSG